MYFYTDGSADSPLSSETRRAAWAVVQLCAEQTHMLYLFLLLKPNDLKASKQTISRAELAAVTWII